VWSSKRGGAEHHYRASTISHCGEPWKAGIPIYSPDQRFQQEAGKPQSVGRFALRALQFSCEFIGTSSMTPAMATG
jgi:hypothetical protein